MRLEITANAYHDLDDIEAYTINLWGQQQASRYLDAIYAALDRIMAAPELLLRSDDRISENLVFYRVEKHFIFCDIAEDRLTVLSVQHVARDLPARINELEAGLSREAAILHQKAEEARARRKKKSR